MPPVLYPVHTPPLYWIVVGALSMLGVACAGLLVYMLSGGYVSHLSWTILILGGIMTVLPLIYLWTTDEYRARGAIRLTRELVEVPDAHGNLLPFPVAHLELVVTHVKVRYTVGGIPMATVSRGKVLDLRAEGRRRRISMLALVDPDQGESLLADLERVRRGEDPRGPEAFFKPPSPSRPRDALEAELDRELAALD